MSEQFDPYHVWLAIAPEDQPPTLYRLLGLRTFEDSPDVIENAADQRMAHLRTFQSGKHSAESQKLLNEVSSAKIALLNPKKKADYDEKLREQMRQKAKGEEDKELSSTLAGFLEQVDLTEHKSPVRTKPASTPAAGVDRKVVIGSAVGGGALLLLTLIVWGLVSSGGGPKKPPEAAATPERRQPAVPPARSDPRGPQTSKPALAPDERSGEAAAPPTVAERPPVTASPAPGPPMPDDSLAAAPDAGPTIDLLKLIDPKRDTIRGESRIENGVLVLVPQVEPAPATGVRREDNRVRIPYTPPAEYAMTVVVERKPHCRGDFLNIGLVVGDHQTSLILDGWSCTASQLMPIDGASEHKEGRGRGNVLPARHPVTIVCTVRKTGVRVTVDGGQLIHVQGGFDRFSPAEAAGAGDKASLFIGKWMSAGFNVHKLTLAPIGVPPENPPPPAEVAARPEPPAPTETRLPVPPAAEQQKKVQQLDEVYKFSERRTPDERLKLAGELYALAKEFRGDPAGKFVLLRKAMESARSGGDAKLMLDIVEAMGAEFRLDLLAAKQSVLTEFAAGTPDAGQIKAFLEAADPVIDQALGDGRCDVAVNIAEAAYSLGQQGAGKDFRKQTYDRRNDVRKRAASWQKTQDARTALETNPDDPEANVAVGRWFCFERNDWGQGLPCLAKSGHAALEAPARQETAAPPTTPDAQVALADVWWDLAEKAEGKEREALMLHAGQWYTKAEAGLSEGFAKIKVQKRLAEVAKIDRPTVGKQAKAERPTVSKLPKELTIDLPGGVKMEFVLIPAGEFMMGDANGRDDEKPVHKVRIAKPFYLGKYAVTQTQWQAVMGSNPSQFQGPTNPVMNVSWDDIQPFLVKVNAVAGALRVASAVAGKAPHSAGTSSGKSPFGASPMLFALPTEAQWEYACRAGTTTAFCFGDNAALLNDHGWFDGNSGGKTHPVGQRKPNAWGLYDMHGNVWEWCADWYAGGYYAQSPPVDPVGPPGGSDRVLRGGAWLSPPGLCRAASRHRTPPTDRGARLDLGFRLALISADAAPDVVEPDQPEPVKPPKVGAARPKAVPKELAIDLPGGVKMELVAIPAGEFVMGSPENERQFAFGKAKAAGDTWAINRIPTEGPQHRVKITKPFYLGKHEVTQAQWQAVMGNNPSGSRDPASPIGNVSWEETQSFLSKLNAVVGRVSNPSGSTGTGYKPVLPPGTSYKAVLPTEAQWEYACRAGAATAFCFGDDGALLGEFGWCRGNSDGMSHAVGQKRPNAWGLYDMHGSVWEWCADWFGADYFAQSPHADPPGAPAGSDRVLRGGSWLYPPMYCRSAMRHGNAPGVRHGDLGFRVALVPVEK